MQRVVNEPEGAGFVAFKANPAHLRAHLVTLPRKGLAAYAGADRRQKPWINALANGLDRGGKLERTIGTLGAIKSRLESANNGD